MLSYRRIYGYTPGHPPPSFLDSTCNMRAVPSCFSPFVHATQEQQKKKQKKDGET